MSFWGTLLAIFVWRFFSEFDNKSVRRIVREELNRALKGNKGDKEYGGDSKRKTDERRAKS